MDRCDVKVVVKERQWWLRELLRVADGGVMSRGLVAAERWLAERGKRGSGARVVGERGRRQ
jgi:hypothetical protein